MLDLGGAAFRSPPASPPPGGRHALLLLLRPRRAAAPRPPHTEPLSPAWRVAEALCIGLPWRGFGGPSISPASWPMILSGCDDGMSVPCRTVCSIQLCFHLSVRSKYSVIIVLSVQACSVLRTFTDCSRMVPDQARVVSAVMSSEAGSDFTLYGVEVTPSDGGGPLDRACTASGARSRPFMCQYFFQLPSICHDCF